MIWSAAFTALNRISTLEEHKWLLNMIVSVWCGAHNAFPSANISLCDSSTRCCLLFHLEIVSQMLAANLIAFGHAAVHLFILFIMSRHCEQKQMKRETNKKTVFHTVQRTHSHQQTYTHAFSWCAMDATQQQQQQHQQHHS